MRRREFITLFGGSAVAWPLAARAQQQAMPVIGYLSARSPEDTAHLVPVFRRALAENGFVEGQTVTIEYRWALGHPDRLPAMAAELVRKPGDGLPSSGGGSGEPVPIKYRWPRARADRRLAMAAELGRKPVDVLASTGGESAALAAKAATS